jgi:hypothetical protein
MPWERGTLSAAVMQPTKQQRPEIVDATGARAVLPSQ